MPGLVVSRYNVVGSYGGGDGGAVFARGQGTGRPGSEIAFSVDGIPKFVGVWTHPLLDDVSVDLAQEIDVYKGAQPVLFGNTAFASIDVVSRRRAEEGFGRRAGGAYGSFSTSALTAEASGRTGAAATRASRGSAATSWRRASPPDRLTSSSASTRSRTSRFRTPSSRGARAEGGVTRPDARTALLFGITAAAAPLSGPIPAAGVILLSAGLAAVTGFSWPRLGPLAGSFAFFLLLVPFAPGPVARAVLQGLGVSVAVVVPVSAARWDRLVAALQAPGAGPATVAFVAINLSHLDAAGRDARVALDALRLRGGFRGASGLGRSTPLLLARTLRNAFERADRTAEALELRGFAGRLPPPTTFRANLADLAAAAASLQAVVLAVGNRLSGSR